MQQFIALQLPNSLNQIKSKDDDLNLNINWSRTVELSSNVLTLPTLETLLSSSRKLLFLRVHILWKKLQIFLRNRKIELVPVSFPESKFSKWRFARQKTNNFVDSKCDNIPPPIIRSQIFKPSFVYYGQCDQIWRTFAIFVTFFKPWQIYCFFSVW